MKISDSTPQLSSDHTQHPQHPQHPQQNSESNNTSENATTSRWNRLSLPNIGLPWQQGASFHRKKSTMASESEILEAMKEANKERNCDLSRIDENDECKPMQGPQKDIRLMDTNNDHLDTIDLSDPLSGPIMFAAGYTHHSNRFSEAYSISTQEPTRPSTTTSLQRSSQLSHLRRSDLPFSYQHQHQQQDSVNSMQQFYYHHSPDEDEDDISSYDCRYGAHELQQQQASRYCQDYYNCHEPVNSYHVHGHDHVPVIQQPHDLQVQGIAHQQQPLSPPYFQQPQQTKQENPLAKSHSSRQEDHESHINSNGSDSRFITNKTIANLVRQNFHNHSNSTASSSTVSSASLSTSSICSSSSTVIQPHTSPTRSRTADSTTARTPYISSPVHNTSPASPLSYSSSVTTTTFSSPSTLKTQPGSPADLITTLKKASSRRMDEITADPRHVTRDHILTVKQVPVDNHTSVSGSHSSMTSAGSTHNGQGDPGEGGTGSGSATDEETSYAFPTVDWRAVKDSVSVCHIFYSEIKAMHFFHFFFINNIGGNALICFLNAYPCCCSCRLDPANIEPCSQRTDCNYYGGSGDHCARDGFAAAP